jgi:nitrogen fixation protein FixH
MAALVAGIVAVYGAVNGAMFWVASRHPTALVGEDYYAESRRYDAVQSARGATLAAGWRVEAQAPRAGEIALRILDRGGRPAAGFAGQALAWRPNDPALDQALDWREDAAQPGLYHAAFARPAAGQWVLRLALRRGGERLDQELRATLP